MFSSFYGVYISGVKFCFHFQYISFHYNRKIIIYTHNALLKNFEYFSLSVFTFVNILFVEIHIRFSCLIHRPRFLKYFEYASEFRFIRINASLIFFTRGNCTTCIIAYFRFALRFIVNCINSSS